jgi:hypothetical protein
MTRSLPRCKYCTEVNFPIPSISSSSSSSPETMTEEDTEEAGATSDISTAPPPDAVRIAIDPLRVACVRQGMSSMTMSMWMLMSMSKSMFDADVDVDVDVDVVVNITVNVGEDVDVNVNVDIYVIASCVVVTPVCVPVQSQLCRVGARRPDVAPRVSITGVSHHRDKPWRRPATRRRVEEGMTPGRETGDGAREGKSIQSSPRPDDLHN